MGSLVFAQVRFFIPMTFSERCDKLFFRGKSGTNG